ncbi:hypothetical protein ACSBR2_013254 [Camellia fascicularis]
MRYIWLHLQLIPSYHHRICCVAVTAALFSIAFVWLPYNISLLLNDRLWIHLIVIPLFSQCHINNNLIHFHPKRFTFQRKRRRRIRRRTNKT